MKELIPQEIIEQKIFLIRGRRVMLDVNLAKLYQVPTKVFNQAVKRNIDRFPDDFMFQLSKEKVENLKSQFVISSWGSRRYLPYAFTEQGVAMLSSVLKSKRAIYVNIQIWSENMTISSKLYLRQSKSYWNHQNHRQNHRHPSQRGRLGFRWDRNMGM